MNSDADAASEDPAEARDCTFLRRSFAATATSCDFADYRLRINGLVANPVELDLARLRSLPHHEQITQHFCIQGWSGGAKWGGVSMRTILDLVRPQPEAKWVILSSLGDGADKGVYYDAHPIEQMSHHLTMLAYDMNDEPLPFGRGAPLRLRNEVELGFKQSNGSKASSSSRTAQRSAAATAAIAKTTSSSGIANPSNPD